MQYTRDIMRSSDDNMGWCKPYISSRVSFAIAHGKVESLRIDGADVPVTEDNLELACQIANPDADNYRGWSSAHILVDGDVSETSCSSCPWFDVCAAMDEPIEDTETIGDRIRLLRKAAGLTQVQLAQLIGRPQQDVSRWENGIVTPTVSSLKKLASALDCAVSDLI